LRSASVDCLWLIRKLKSETQPRLCEREMEWNGANDEWGKLFTKVLKH
jgi:hypothetical protein